ncbi:hypothetical protein BV898_00312 [Hypsibius exemplaris]|uniref:SUEL-type lectin domain-containing protein n=1 Tax=Hypsibius exemplaris TaxID=2072580 RepID=A0A1W0XFP5_HYPEX|nr:hypothetical protein BV898_00312 [Hypsibius exemplaris]
MAIRKITQACLLLQVIVLVHSGAPLESVAHGNKAIPQINASLLTVIPNRSVKTIDCTKKTVLILYAKYSYGPEGPLCPETDITQRVSTKCRNQNSCQVRADERLRVRRSAPVPSDSAIECQTRPLRVSYSCIDVSSTTS